MSKIAQPCAEVFEAAMTHLRKKLVTTSPEPSPAGKDSEKEGRFGDNLKGNHPKNDAESEEWFKVYAFSCEYRCKFLLANF